VTVLGSTQGRLKGLSASRRRHHNVGSTSRVWFCLGPRARPPSLAAFDEGGGSHHFSIIRNYGVILVTSFCPLSIHDPHARPLTFGRGPRPFGNRCRRPWFRNVALELRASSQCFVTKASGADGPSKRVDVNPGHDRAGDDLDSNGTVSDEGRTSPALLSNPILAAVCQRTSSCRLRDRFRCPREGGRGRPSTDGDRSNTRGQTPFVDAPQPLSFTTRHGVGHRRRGRRALAPAGPCEFECHWK